MSTANLKDKAGATVVSIEVARRTFDQRAVEPCSHMSVTVDPLLAYLVCRKCNAHVNPIEWIATIVDHWACVDLLHEKLRVQQNYLRLEREALERQRRSKCEHCKRFTRVHLARDRVREVLQAVQSIEKGGNP